MRIRINNNVFLNTKILAGNDIEVPVSKFPMEKLGTGRQQEGFFDFQIKTAFLRDVQSKNIFPRIRPDTHPQHWS